MNFLIGETSTELLRLVEGWMELHPSLHVIFVPPLYRTIGSFKEDSSAFMVEIYNGGVESKH